MNKFLWIGILAVTWPGGMTAQPLDTTFSRVGPPTPEIPPPGVGILADVGWGFPVVQGITTATVAELLRE